MNMGGSGFSLHQAAFMYFESPLINSLPTCDRVEGCSRSLLNS
ncbi:unnamed protein product [Linum tenue]|uniref:Uncharacterized protein n=1 Tax=Linum tenue TaxID=586396 RepID=A0AAV0LCL1_9ROSI|nr:unnamed protein product [Linum tenue]